MNWLYLANYSHSCDALSCFSMYRRGTFHHSSSFLSDVFFPFSFKVKDLPAPHLSRHPFKHVQLQEHLFCGNCTCLQGTQLTFNHFCWTWIPYCPYLYFYFFFLNPCPCPSGYQDNVVCLSPRLAQSLGNMGQVCVCVRVTSTIHLIDPTTLQSEWVFLTHLFLMKAKSILA